MASDEEPPEAPSFMWQAGSRVIVGVTGLASRAFLLGANRLEVNGLDNFVKLLEDRRDVDSRERGFEPSEYVRVVLARLKQSIEQQLTAQLHVRLDDPLMWGALPVRHIISPNNLRWALGSHDLVFRNLATSYFFSFGQVLPTHRLAHSQYGGLFQPTITQTIRLLSKRPFTRSDLDHEASRDITDPFSSAELTYTTNGKDSIHAPSAYLCRRHAWVHVFPEGKIHQRPDRTMRYFKWGVSRLILESEPCPLLVPIWIEGFEQTMHESRRFPRPIPRPGKDINVTFGEQVDMEARFGDLRKRWQVLVERERATRPEQNTTVGEVPEALKHDEEAVKIREECTIRVREEVLKLRRQRGWPDEDPKARLVDTWRQEGRKDGKSEGRMADGSWVRDH